MTRPYELRGTSILHPEHPDADYDWVPKRLPCCQSKICLLFPTITYDDSYHKFYMDIFRLLLNPITGAAVSLRGVTSRSLCPIVTEGKPPAAPQGVIPLLLR